jgi:hypothetical protein
MVMTVSVMDKLQFKERKSAYIEKLIDVDFLASALFFKYLVHSLKNAEPLVRQWNEDIFEDREVFKRHFDLLVEFMIEEASVKEKDKLSELYSTSDLAKFIGVSQQSINKWIKTGKIRGVNREGREHAKIPDDAEVMYPNGVVLLVSELKEAWEKESVEPITDEVTYLKHCINEFKELYGGSFEETLGALTLLDLTSEQETDASAWKSYLKRLSDAETTSSNT